MPFPVLPAQDVALLRFLPPQDVGTPGGVLDKIGTGHTLDDQAETVLMRIIRGTGMRGLGGIHPRVVVADDDDEPCGEIVRPLLGVRRRELQQYLTEINQPWREDSSNADAKFTRNRMRQLVLPLLEPTYQHRKRSVRETMRRLRFATNPPATAHTCPGRIFAGKQWHRWRDIIWDDGLSRLPPRPRRGPHHNGGAIRFCIDLYRISKSMPS